MWEFWFSTSITEEYTHLLTTSLKKTLNTGNLHTYSQSKQTHNNIISASIETQNPSYLFQDDTIMDTKTLLTKNFSSFPLKAVVPIFDKAYTNLKLSTDILSNNPINLYGTNQNYVQPTSYTQTLNSFRSNYKEALLLSNTNSRKFFLNTSNSSLILKEGDRLVNPMKIRSPAKNSIVTYNAIQKVFKSRFDEGRSNSRLEDISSSITPKLFISADRVSYENLLKKNTENFFNPVTYNKHLLLSYNNTTPIANSLNMYATGIPFLLSTYSDPSRHIWTD